MRRGKIRKGLSEYFNRGELRDAADPAQATDKIVVHVQTKVQTVLGVLTPDGNVTQKIPVEFELELTEKSFAEAYVGLKAKVAELQKQIDDGQQQEGGPPQGA